MKQKERQERRPYTHREIQSIRIAWAREHQRRLAIRNRAALGNGIVVDAIRKAGLS